VEERRAGTVDQRADEPNRCSSDVVIWRKGDRTFGPWPGSDRDFVALRHRTTFGVSRRGRLPQQPHVHAASAEL